jgi:uncharacterized protein (DUF305 family)
MSKNKKGNIMKNNNNLLYAMVGAVIGGALVWFSISTGVRSNNYGMMRMMGFSSLNRINDSQSSVIDAHFIEQMIPHHEDAITMSKLALTKARRPEIKQLAQNIIQSQGKEITQMKDWYQLWFDREIPTGSNTMNQHGMMGGSQMHMGMMGNDTDVTRLENSQDFDRSFVEDMIPHHQMAVMMASMLKNGTTRPEMKTLADDIIAAQTKEIDMMRTWLTDWNK